ncbi:MAG: acetyl-CoA C-acetyltransferase [Synergistaceae bacterium]|nr:acetyl-CoA C-acetyltransferase [Synergistaceae bacterium]
MNEVYIVSGVRTALGNLGGGLQSVLPEALLVPVIRESIVRGGVAADRVSEVVMGQTKQSADCPNVARVAALKARLPEEIPAYTVHRQCGSGMQAVISSVTQIRCGESELVVAGGVESMSNAQYYLRDARYGFKVSNGIIFDPNTESQPKSQPEETYGKLVMGMTAENLAERYTISREAQDEFALRSQRLAVKAMDSGRFAEEIVPVPIPQRKGEALLFDTDEYPRRDASLESLAKLKPAFKNPGGTVTAGNSSGRNDGAAALLLASEEMVKREKLTPLARVAAFASAGVDPRYMGIGPVPASLKALEKAGLALSDIGLVEINEAFAAQTLACVKELDLDVEKLNVNGGAVALGHPLGCSGARILLTLAHEMKRKNTRYGLAAICIAGGQGLAMVVERA